MDSETQKIVSVQEKLYSLVTNEGWSIARAKLTDKILELQRTARYADLLEKNDERGLIIATKSDLVAVEILYSWLQELEGEAYSVEETKQLVDKPYIARL